MRLLRHAMPSGKRSAPRGMMTFRPLSRGAHFSNENISTLLTGESTFGKRPSRKHQIRPGLCLVR